MSDSAWYPIISFPAVFGRSLGLGFRPPSLGNRAPERLGSAQMQENVVNGGLVGGLRIPGREVKFADPRETTNCESRDLARFHQSGTKAGGSNTIRYRSSPGPKRYRPGFGEKLFLLGISRVRSVRALVQALGVGAGVTSSLRPTYPKVQLSGLGGPGSIVSGGEGSTIAHSRAAPGPLEKSLSFWVLGGV